MVENLARNRQPYPQLEAVYFLTPDEDSVKRFIRDFDGKPLYAGAHVFFSNGGSLSNPITSRLVPDLLFKPFRIDYSISSNPPPPLVPSKPLKNSSSISSLSNPVASLSIPPSHSEPSTPLYLPRKNRWRNCRGRREEWRAC